MLNGEGDALGKSGCSQFELSIKDDCNGTNKVERVDKYEGRRENEPRLCVTWAACK